MDDYKLVVEDIIYAIDLIEHRPEQDTVDYKVYDVLNESLKQLEEMNELLKGMKKQPRVLTLKELEAIPSNVDIWGEVKGVERIFAQTTFVSWLDYPYDFRDGVMNGELRYWTARPTEEQRNEVKWGG